MLGGLPVFGAPGPSRGCNNPPLPDPAALGLWEQLGGGLHPGAERDWGCRWAGLAPGSSSGFGGPDCPPPVTLQKSPPAPGFVL